MAASRASETAPRSSGVSPRPAASLDPSSTVQEQLGCIVGRLDPSELAQRLAREFRSAIPGYRRLPAAVVSERIVDVSRLNLELFIRSITAQVQPSEEELAPFRRSAEERATEGMALEDLLAAYRLGGRLGWQAICDAAGPGEQDALLLGAELTMRYVDRVSSAVAQTYLDERQHLVSEEERCLRDLLDALVCGNRLSAALREHAERVGFGVADRYRPFAYRRSGVPAREHSATASALRGQGLLALTEGDRVSGLAPASATPADFSDSRALLALATITEAADLPEVMDEVRLLVDLGESQARHGLIEAGDFLPELLLARSPRLARELHTRVLAPLEAHVDPRGSDLLGTLRAFVACAMDRRRSAAELHIHPNTLDHRTGRIEELTGLDLDRPDDVALVSLALRAHASVASPRLGDATQRPRASAPSS